MDYFVPEISPVNMMGSSMVQGSRITTKEDANKAFVNLFLSQVLKNIMNAQNDLYGSDSANTFSNDIYNDVLINKMSEELAQDNVFGFGSVFGPGSNMRSSINIGDVQ